MRLDVLLSGVANFVLQSRQVDTSRSVLKAKWTNDFDLRCWLSGPRPAATAATAATATTGWTGTRTTAATDVLADWVLRLGADRGGDRDRASPRAGVDDAEWPVERERVRSVTRTLAAARVSLSLSQLPSSSRRRRGDELREWYERSSSDTAKANNSYVNATTVNANERHTQEKYHQG